MRVKIGDQLFDPNVTPVMVILTDADKANIAAMPEHNRRYAMYPKDTTKEEVDAFMNTGFPAFWLEDGAARVDGPFGGTDADWNADGTRKTNGARQ